MPVLLEDTQKQVEQLLVKNGLIKEEDLKAVRQKAHEKGEPLFALLVNEEHVTAEDLTKAIAQATRVPYVNLQNARVDPKILSLLQQDIAERYMAVPLGEMQNRLVVAMLDASNVQAVDFLSNKIGRPLKVYMASQEGIENVIKQYSVDVSKDVAQALDTKDAADEAQKKTKKKTFKLSSKILQLVKH
jgi:type IV pilus assembly protein PilB